MLLENLPNLQTFWQRNFCISPMVLEGVPRSTYPHQKSNCEQSSEEWNYLEDRKSFQVRKSCKKCITYCEGWRQTPDSRFPMPDAWCLAMWLDPRHTECTNFSGGERRRAGAHTDIPTTAAYAACGQQYGWAIKICRQANKCRPYPKAKKPRRGKTNRQKMHNHFIAVFKMPQNLPTTRPQKMGTQWKARWDKVTPGRASLLFCAPVLAVRKQIWSNKKLKLKVPLQLTTWPLGHSEWRHSFHTK